MTDDTARHLDPRRPAARRRPLRLRPVQGPARGGRRARPRRRRPTSAPATARRPCGSWSARLRNGLAELFALPDGYEVLLGNGGTDRVLGRRHLRPDRAAQPAPAASASSRRSSRRPPRPRPTSTSPRSSSRRRAPIPMAVGRRRRRRSTPSPTTRPRPAWPCRCAARRAPTRTRSSLVDATSAAGGLRFDPPQVDVYYFAPQKCLASDGGLWLAAVSPGRGRADRAHRRVGPLGPGVARPVDRRSRTPARTRPTTPRRWPRCSWPSQQVEWINDNGGLEWAAVAVRPVGRDHVRLGRGVGLRHAVRGRPGRAQPRGRHHRPRRLDRRHRGVEGAAGQRHRRHRVLPQARAATSCASRMFPAIDPADVEALTALHRPRGRPRSA